MPADELGRLEREKRQAYQHHSIVISSGAIVVRRAELERASWFRGKPSCPKTANGFLGRGPLYRGELVEADRRFGSVMIRTRSSTRQCRSSTWSGIRNRGGRGFAGNEVEPGCEHAATLTDGRQFDVSQSLVARCRHRSPARTTYTLPIPTRPLGLTRGITRTRRGREALHGASSGAERNRAYSALALIAPLRC